MSVSDEQAIRDLLSTWHRATAEGDLDRVLPLMAEDVVYLQPGQPPMRGRDSFAAGFRAIAKRVSIESRGEIRELRVAGDWAYCWSHLTVTVTPREGGAPMRRSGPVLSVFRKEPGGRWVLARDANMLTAEPAHGGGSPRGSLSERGTE